MKIGFLGSLGVCCFGIILSGCKTPSRVDVITVNQDKRLEKVFVRLSDRIDYAVQHPSHDITSEQMVQAANKAYASLEKARSVYFDEAQVANERLPSFPSVIKQLDLLVRDFRRQTPEALQRSMERAQRVIDILPLRDRAPMVTTHYCDSDGENVRIMFAGYYLQDELWRHSTLKLPDGTRIDPVESGPTTLAFVVPSTSLPATKGSPGFHSLTLVIPLDAELSDQNKKLGSFQILINPIQVALPSKALSGESGGASS